MISVLIDHDPEVTSPTGPSTYYALSDSCWSNPIRSRCTHRKACIGCDFNLPKQSAKALLLESKASIKRYLEEVPLTPDEKVIIDEDAQKLEMALRKMK